MPGISDNNVQPINTAPIAAIGSEQPATPAVNDFMAAFRSGFITVDDLTRRSKQSAIDTSNLQTTLSANDLTRRKTASEAQLLPGQQAEAQRQQQIQERTAPGRLAEADMQNEASLEKAKEFEEYRRDPQAWLAKKSDQQVEKQYIDNAGPLPETLFTKNPEKPLLFDEWLNVRNQVNADAGEGFSNDASDDPKELKKEYDKYVLAMAQVPVKKGTPEYAKALRKEVNDMAVSSGIQKAKLEAAKTIMEKRAIGGTPHISTVKRINAAGKEEDVSIATDPTTGEVISETILATNAPKLTEVQSNATIFSTRMAQNDKTLTALEQKGFDPSALSTTTQKFLPNRFKSDEVQSYTAAKDNWISAILRKESGAAISAAEYTQANREYFPRDGDSPAVVKQKQDLRRVAEEQVRKAGGAGTAGAPTATAVGTAAPSAGAKRVVQNGVTFEWNGTTYVPIQ